MVLNVALEPAQPGSDADARRLLRARLIAERDAFAASPAFAAACEALSAHLRATLAPLEPACLGLYWPLRSEFNAAAAIAADSAFDNLVRALPFARRQASALEFRRWDGGVPSIADECGIASSNGAAVDPDVVVVPCVGFTEAGHRLGYGGGYYDRWLASRPHVVAIGIAWAQSEIDALTFAARPDDVPLSLVVTEAGVR